MHPVQDERPRVALNAQLLRMNEGYRSAGIARYIYHLLRELPRAASDLQLNVYSTEPEAATRLSDITIHTTRLPAHKPLARILWEQTILPFELLQKNYTLFHSLAYVSPFLNRTPTIVTLYDLSFILYPEYFRAFQRLYLRFGTRLSVARAQRIITISESTKRDAIQLLNVDANRIDVITPGVESEFFHDVDANTIAQFRRNKNLPDPFILFVGTREPRKNIPTLLRAFAQATRAAQLPHSLVIAGARGWMDQTIPQMLAELNIAKDVFFPGFVPHTELPLWYRAADAFVYPSQYEGFGMPPLEALACGTPTITSNVSSLPEAVGDAALLIDPRSPEQLAAALIKILTDSALRDELRGRGFQHARQFTWTRAAQQTAQTYRRALGTHPVPLYTPASV